MKRLLLMVVLLVAVALTAAGCASTGSTYPHVDVGGSYQFRYTTFPGGSR